GARKAIERLNGAVGEIERMARSDAALAGEGAVLLLETLSPAVNIDSSSGALGNATAGVVETLAPLIAAAPVPRPVREKWLERLFDAVQEDDPPYIESLGEHRNIRARRCKSYRSNLLLRRGRDGRHDECPCRIHP
nr:hypothetical protein [Methylibium sp.]MBA3590117.1 hypothetical protein [Methylibium sp.]